MTPDDPILCRSISAVPLPPTVSGVMMYMPGGLQTITPIGGGIDKPIRVQVDAAGAAQLNAQHSALSAKGKRPFFDFNHADGPASFWPSEFFFAETPEPGIYARGEWSATGKAGVEGKEWRQFSPLFHVDNKRGNPARIICRDWAKPNMGGLVNEAAFHSISPLWAKESRSSAENQTAANHPNNTMTDKELADLRLTIEGLRGELNGIKAKDSTDAAVASALAAKEAELRTKESELKLAESEKALEALKAKNKAFEDADQQRRAADAKSAVKAAVARGAIAAKDSAAQSEWENLLTADPSKSALLASAASHPALGGRITAPAVKTEAGGVQRGQMGGLDALRAYAAVVAKNAAIPKIGSEEKAELAKEAGAIFARELKGREDDWMNVPLKDAIEAADASTAAVGTLAGTLVLQRSLPLMKFNYPAIMSFFTDFSDATGLWGQTELTRIIITPAVEEYNAALDTNGRPLGFVNAIPAQTVDVPVTLSKHVGIPMVFGVQTLASTVRDLFGEQVTAALNALGGYLVNMATGLMTPANFNAYALNADAAGATTAGSTTLVLSTTAGVYPGQLVSGAGIPAGAAIRSVTDGTHAEMTQAATATGAALAITLGGGNVPALFASYVKALADFNFASLGEIGAAFDNNRVPQDGRSVMLNASYYQRLAQDPTFNTFFAAMNNQAIIGKGMLPELNGFTPQKAPFFPASNFRTGFAYHRAAIALKSRLPVDFSKAVGAMIPGSVTTVTDPDTGLSVLNVQRVDLVGSYAESRIEVMLGANVGDRRAGMVITSQ